MESFWQLGDELRGQSRASEDHEWVMVASKLPEQTRFQGERMNNLDLSKGPYEVRIENKVGFQEENRYESLKFNMLSLDLKIMDNVNKIPYPNKFYNVNPVYHKMYPTNIRAIVGNKYGNNMNLKGKELQNTTINSNINSNTSENNNAVEKRFKNLPATRNEVLGGYIFVCNNDTMQEDLKCQLFGLLPRYRDYVRAITPGLPLFLYNYKTHQLHGIFEAASFDGSNIDPTAWEDNKCKCESRFPTQVNSSIDLGENLHQENLQGIRGGWLSPFLHHYDGLKFWLELSVPETLELLDLCEQTGFAA